jgi:bacteriocin-like protein
MNACIQTLSIDQLSTISGGQGCDPQTPANKGRIESFLNRPVPDFMVRFRELVSRAFAPGGK